MQCFGDIRVRVLNPYQIADVNRRQLHILILFTMFSMILQQVMKEKQLDL